MAEPIRLKVLCHACGGTIVGAGKYGKGHFVPDGVLFEVTATGKRDAPGGKRVRLEVECICPYCEVRNRYQL